MFFLWNQRSFFQLCKTSMYACGNHHRITESFELEGTFKGHLVQLYCNKQGHLQLDQMLRARSGHSVILQFRIGFFFYPPLFLCVCMCVFLFFQSNVLMHQYNADRKHKAIHSVGLNANTDKTQLVLFIALGIRKWCVHSA